jgi:predicted GH43/DUF377 family glycosyl hydrolase
MIRKLQESSVVVVAVASIAIYACAAMGQTNIGDFTADSSNVNVNNVNGGINGHLAAARKPERTAESLSPDLGNAYYRRHASVAAVVALADKVPMLRVNLNNYKYHGNPILRGGTPGQWDEAGIERVVVYRVGPADWRMWYGGRCKDESLKIGYATSKDGIQWSKYEGNPVLEGAEEWEGKMLSPTGVAQVDGLFYLYYWGPGHRTPDKIKRIGLAVSKDGIQWEKKGVVLDADPPILNESPASGGTGVDAAKVFYLREEERWYMIFTGFGTHGHWNGLAESKDAIHWKKIKAPLVATQGPHSSLGGAAGSIRYWRGGTLRCPIQIGSVWVGFATAHGCWLPSAALTLDEWVTFGTPVMSANQDYETGMVPWGIEAADESYYIYYQIVANRKQNETPSIGLIRAPVRLIHQPMLLWEKEKITVRTISMILEPDGGPISFNLTSDQPGEARVLVWNPVDRSWIELNGASVEANRLCTLGMPMHTRVRLAFTPAKSPAIVSAWAIMPGNR